MRTVRRREYGEPDAVLRRERVPVRHDVLDGFTRHAEAGRFTIARTFGLEYWRMALDVGQSGHAHGKPPLGFRCAAWERSRSPCDRNAGLDFEKCHCPRLIAGPCHGGLFRSFVREAPNQML
ncbi:MAG: hypothetical protein ACRDP6_31310 [Actinoallomurus sp.]